MQLRSAVLMPLLLSALTGGAYPLLVTVLGQVLFADQAGGSLIQRADGSVVGSRLIAQKFSGPEWFQPRRGLRPDSRQGPDRQRSEEGLFRPRFNNHEPIRLMGIRCDLGDGLARGQRDGASQPGRVEN